MIRSDENDGKAPMTGALLEKAVLLVLVLLAATAFHMAGAFSDGTPSGGHVFPRLASGAVLTMAIVALFQGQPAGLQTEFSRKPFVVVVLTLAFLGLMPIIGYPLVAPIVDWHNDVGLWVTKPGGYCADCHRTQCDSVDLACLAWPLRLRLLVCTNLYSKDYV